MNEKIANRGPDNVVAVPAKGYSTSVASEAADVVYELDTFHVVEEPQEPKDS